MQYGLSAQRIIRVIRAPLRIVEGVAKNTIAVMQPSSTRKGEKGDKIWKQEIWVMYQIKKMSGEKRVVTDLSKNDLLSDLGFGKSQIRIISAWRYPGVSPKGEELPEEILEEIAEAGII